jgi:hypothetical protein
MSRPAGPVHPARREAAFAARRVGRGGAVLGALLASAAVTSSASAAAPSWATIQTPLMPYVVADADAGSTAATATGNGRAAWVTVGGAPSVASVWTLRAGAAVKVADVPMRSSGLGAVELGTAKDGTPVLFVGTREDGTTPTVLRLVRLDTGAVRIVASVRRGLRVGGMAIDAGRLYYSVSTPGKTGPRNTSSLWRATLTGTSIGPATKLRTSRRGERWNAVHADLGRVAVETSGDPHSDSTAVFLRENVAFGTPRGAWSRSPTTYASEGGYVPIFVLGFTKDRKALVVERGLGSDGTQGAEVLRMPIGGGRGSAVRLGRGPLDLRASSLDAATGRLLAFGPDAAGVASIGWTGVAVR